MALQNVCANRLEKREILEIRSVRYRVNFECVVFSSSGACVWYKFRECATHSDKVMQRSFLNFKKRDLAATWTTLSMQLFHTPEFLKTLKNVQTTQNAEHVRMGSQSSL